MEMSGPVVSAVACLAVFTTLSFVTVCLRLYTRVVLLKNTGTDDVLIVGSMMSAIGFFAIVILQIKYGLGRRIALQEVESFLMALWGTIPLYNAALSLCKLSITVQYCRVFRTVTLQRTFQIILVVLVVYSLWSVLGTILTCWPVEKYWDYSKEGTCLDRNAITFANAGINIATDVVLLALPLPLLGKLQIPKKQKIILVGVFACGGLACAMSIIRLYSLYEIGITPPSRQSIKGVNIAIWSGIEINVGITCASVPALKSLGVRVLPKLLLSNLYGRGRTQGEGRYIRHENVSSGRPSGGVIDVSCSDTATSTKPQITIEQSFEMNTINAEGFSCERDTSGTRDSTREVSCYAPAVLRGPEP